MQRFKVISKLYIISSFVVFILLLCFCSEGKILATPSETENIPLILIDAGHGGRDGGAVSRNGVLEKHINLSISLKLKEKLQAQGYQVLMIREKDEDFYGNSSEVYAAKRHDLNTRCKVKRESNCDLFISIHQNYFAQSSCKGAQVWYSRNEESKSFAKVLQENLRRDLGKNHREEKPAKDAYKILRCYTNIPSVIVECGFLTNPEEEKKLVTMEYQNKIVECIAKSIIQYYEAQTSQKF
jgi:N-acetylmuramoyl-L-alanine amidase